MRIKILALLIMILFTSCQLEKQIDYELISNKFKEYSERIEKIEFKTTRIDTFAQNDVIVNSSGFAMIERDKSDDIFGFSFYGKRDDVPNEYIYDKHMGFDFSQTDKTYKSYYAEYGFKGSPGGQMIPSNIFELDSTYKSVVVRETNLGYEIKYTYEDDTLYAATDIYKIIEITRNNFFPFKVIYSSTSLGYKTTLHSLLSDVKINDEVQNSIKKYKNLFEDFQLIDHERRQSGKLLGLELPQIFLPNLHNSEKKRTVIIKKPTLLDFWEVWCGPCVASLTKVENLKTKFVEQINIIGFVSKDIESAKELIELKGITFENLIGNNELKESFGINSWPRYLLVDKNGIVKKEYFGFSDQIEKDISEMLEN